MTDDGLDFWRGCIVAFGLGAALWALIFVVLYTVLAQ